MGKRQRNRKPNGDRTPGTSDREAVNGEQGSASDSCGLVPGSVAILAQRPGFNLKMTTKDTERR